MDKSPVQSRRRPAAAKHPARGPRTDGANTRTLILDAARRRLIEQGYASLNVRDIARDAGVNHALIGYHFNGKQQLVLAVLDEVNTRLLERQSRMYAEPARASQKWHQACGFYEEDLQSGYVKLLMALMGASFHDESLRREFTPRLLAWQSLIEQAVDEYLATSGIELPVTSRAVSAWITWFWIGLEASMALGIPEEQGHQREALQAMTSLLRLTPPRTAAPRAKRRA